MLKSGCRFTLDGFAEALASLEDEVKSKCREVGEAAVEYARVNGSYRDVTGRLRASNKYKADAHGLEVFNDAPYASDVEARGHEVVSGAALFAEAELKKSRR